MRNVQIMAKTEGKGPISFSSAKFAVQMVIKFLFLKKKHWQMSKHRELETAREKKWKHFQRKVEESFD